MACIDRPCIGETWETPDGDRGVVEAEWIVEGARGVLTIMARLLLNDGRRVVVESQKCFLRTKM